MLHAAATFFLRKLPETNNVPLTSLKSGPERPGKYYEQQMQLIGFRD